MVSVKTSQITCDTCSKTGQMDHGTSIKALRSLSFKEGWVLNHARDYCPACWEKMEKGRQPKPQRGNIFDADHYFKNCTTL